MTKARLISIIGITISMFITGLAHADAQHDPRIRQELRGAEIGDHTAFAVLVADFRDEQQTHPDVAWQIVKKAMQLDSDQARSR